MSVSRFATTLWLVTTILCLGGCAGGPPTRYYDLRSGDLEPVAGAGQVSGFSLGLAQVVLPDVYDQPSIVSLEAGNQVALASYHVWAGKFDDSINRLLRVNLARLTGQAQVWTAPWDNRFRPEYQIRVVIHELVGGMTSGARLKATWTLLADQGNRLVGTWQFTASAENKSGNYDGYVAAINSLLDDLSVSMARELVVVAAGPAH